MWAICFSLVVSSVLAAPGVSRTCYNYCKSKESEAIPFIMPLGCNCADSLDTVIESEEPFALTLDDTGVYFVPVEEQLIPRQFNSRPFFISNPAKLVPKAINRINREFDSSKQSASDLLPSQSEHIEIYKKTEIIAHTTINRESGKSPLYLDIDIQDTTDKNRADAHKDFLIEDFGSTEKALVECLDFQVIHYTRKFGFMKEFKDFWEARNLNKYDHLSDIDVEENIQTWCSEPDAIVRQSLHEIKEGLPKKVPDSRFISRSADEDSKTNTKEKKDAINMTEKTQEMYTTTPWKSTSLDDNTTEMPETNNKNTEANNLLKNAAETIATTYNPIENWTSTIPTSSSTLSENNILKIQLGSSVVTPPDTDATTSQNTLITEDSEKTVTTEKSKETTTIDTKYDLETMASEDNLHTYVPALTEFKIIDEVHNLNNNTSFHDVPTTPISTSQFLETSNTFGDIDVFSDQTLNTQISVTEPTLEHRHVYKEKELKIPKIITKECSNNTVQTTIDGIEELPNDDFKETESDLMGRLYFVYNKELVPVRFTQTKGGTISLSMDGAEICAKLNLKTHNKSGLLTAFCEYIQSHINKDIIK